MIKHNLTLRPCGKAALLCVVAFVACLAAGCRKAPEKIDLSSTHTTVAETMAPDTKPQATPSPSEDVPETEPASNPDPGSKNISTKMNTYTSGKASIQYPSLVNMDDPAKAAAIDELIKKNALSVLDAYQIQDSRDALDISCQVLSADRSRITLLYHGTLAPDGSAHPQNLFYSNTIDVSNASDIGFSHYADPYTMAGYVLSDDCTFYQADEELKPELMKEKGKTSLDDYTKMFNGADFPFTGDFPQSFSYEHQGVIYFSIPMPHALGDYAIVMFAPDAK